MKTEERIRLRFEEFKGIPANERNSCIACYLSALSWVLEDEK